MQENTKITSPASAELSATQSLRVACRGFEGKEEGKRSRGVTPRCQSLVPAAQPGHVLWDTRP